MIIGSVAVFVLTLTVGFYLIVTYRKIPRSFAATQNSNRITQEVFQMNLAVDDFFYGKLDRGIAQWDMSRDSLRAIISLVEKSESSEMVSIKDLRLTLKEVDALFLRLQKGDVPPKVGMRLVDLIKVKLQDMIFTSHRLLSDIQMQLLRAERRADLLIVLFIGAVAIIVIATSYFFNRIVLDPIRRLRRGLEIAGKGDLDHRIEIIPDDEFGDLARGFNHMAANLAVLSKTRDQFLSAAAHELKTPVTIIKGYVQLMAQWSPDELLQERQGVVDILDHQCDHMGKLVQDLLELSRLQLEKVALHKERFRYDTLVVDSVSDMQRVTKRHHLVVTGATPTEIIGDKGRLEEVLVNLLDNAIKYSPAGGEITINLQRQNHEIITSVQDHGIGIPDRSQPHMFERFYRAHVGTPYELSSSLGVGLYLSREFVERHEGRIWFISKEGIGSTFSFSLPLPQ